MKIPRIKNLSFAFLLYILFCVSSVFAQTSLVRLEASRAENIGHRPNSQGVYPVRLRWQKSGIETPQNYHVYRSLRAESGFEKISTEVKDEGNSFSAIDNNPAAVPGKPYYYRIMFVNSAGEVSLFSETVMGYGALSHEQFFLEYVKTLRTSHQKLTLMHKPGNTSKLGSEQIQGAISGTLSYQARIAGLGGRVIMEYNRYADLYIDNNRSLGPYFVLTGNMNTTASMNQSGTMDGTVHISGMYPGRVYYDKIQIKSGAAGGGTFGIEPEGFPRSELTWTVGEQ